MIRNIPLLFFITMLVSSCEEKEHFQSSITDSTKIIDTIQQSEQHSDSIKPVREDTLTLFEHSLNNLSIPFTDKNVRSLLTKAFPDYRLSSDTEFDPMDGGTFLVHTLYVRESIAAEIYMQEGDTMRLGSIQSSGPFFKDEYGIKVGDSFEKLTKGKAGEYTVRHDPNAASIVVFKESNIHYEIEGLTKPNEHPALPAEPLDPEMKDWKVTKIVWHSYK